MKTYLNNQEVKEALILTYCRVLVEHFVNGNVMTKEEKTNLKKIPDISLNTEIQYEWYQFRISKSKGRVIGIKIDNVFYIVYLDPFHNLINSEGYGKQKKQPPPNI